MKKKKLATTMLAGVMAFSAIGVSPAFAATGTKTATLNHAQVRFNNGKVQTIQCYNIDGYNFVRARDITNNLGMAVTAVQNGEKGVMVHPYMSPTSTATPEKLTQKTAKVNVVTGKISYDGIPYKTECFLLNGRYYFKLADFQNASENNLDVAIETVEFEAKGKYADGPYLETQHSIEVVWNNDTKVIDVNLVKTDLQEIFDEIRGGKSATTKPEKEEVVKTDEEKKPAVEEKQTLSISEYAEEVIRLVNEEREKAGADPLKMDDDLMKAASVRAEEVTECFSHTRPDGTKFSTAVKEVGYSSSYLGENIAGAFATPEKVVEAWMNSEGHRKNILNDNYNYIGVGVDSNGKSVSSWVQLFAK